MRDRNTLEFKELEATIGKLHRLVGNMGYAYSSYVDERGHVIEVVNVIAECTGANSLEAFSKAVAILEAMRANNERQRIKNNLR